MLHDRFSLGIPKYNKIRNKKDIESYKTDRHPKRETTKQQYYSGRIYNNIILRPKTNCATISPKGIKPKPVGIGLNLKAQKCYAYRIIS